jgi:hypothetical protein
MQCTLEVREGATTILSIPQRAAQDTFAATNHWTAGTTRDTATPINGHILAPLPRRLLVNDSHTIVIIGPSTTIDCALEEIRIYGEEWIDG